MYLQYVEFFSCSNCRRTHFQALLCCSLSVYELDRYSSSFMSFTIFMYVFGLQNWTDISSQMYTDGVSCGEGEMWHHDTWLSMLSYTIWAEMTRVQCYSFNISSNVTTTINAITNHVILVYILNCEAWSVLAESKASERTLPMATTPFVCLGALHVYDNLS